MPSVSGNVGAVASVSSVFGRNGGVVAANGDYSGVVAAHLTGATAATRYVGGTASGAPVTGTFAVGDFVIEQTGKVYVCTVAGTPGTWVAPGGASPSVTDGIVNVAAASALRFPAGTLTEPTPGTAAIDHLVQSITKPVSSAELLDLLANPVEIIPSPGPSMALLPLTYFVIYHFGTTPYNWSGGGFGGADPWLTLGGLSQVDLGSFSGATEDAVMYYVGGQPPDAATRSGATFATACADTPLLLQNFGAVDLVDGDGTFGITVTYVVADLT